MSTALTVDPAVYARRWKTLAVLSCSLRDHRARQHHPQRRAAEPAGGVRCIHLDAAVDRRLVPARVRRPSADDGHARRSLRPQACAAGGLLLFGGASLAVLFADSAEPADRHPRRDGRRRRADHAGDALDHLERLPARGARQGDRHLGGDGGGRHRARPADRRPAARVLRLEVGLPASTCPSPPSPCWPASCSCPRAATRKPGAFDVPGAVLSIGALVSLVYGVIEAPERGWTSPLILGCFGAAAVLGAAFVRWELRTPSRC